MSEEVTAPPAAPAAVDAPGGFLSGLKSAAPVPQDAPAATNPDTWFWDEGVPGSGPKPAWLKDKYGNKVAAQAKAYVEAEKQLGQLGSSAPDSYDFADLKEKLDTANPHLQKFMETAKKNRLPQDTFKDIMGTLVEYEQSKLPNRDAELAKLGDNPQAMIDTIERWASNTLSQDALDTIGQIGTNAGVIKMLDELRQLSLHQQSQPPGSAAAPKDFVVLTQADIEAELAVPANGQRYINDPKYRAEISRKLRIIHGEE